MSEPRDFETIKARLEEIATAVEDDAMSLDEALDLFEEAVALGLAVSDVVEEGIVVDDPAAPGDVSNPSDNTPETATSPESAPVETPVSTSAE